MRPGIAQCPSLPNPEVPIQKFVISTEAQRSGETRFSNQAKEAAHLLDHLSTTFRPRFCTHSDHDFATGTIQFSSQKSQRYREKSHLWPIKTKNPPQLTTNPKDRFFSQQIGPSTALDLTIPRNRAQKTNPR
jgi:hypothetical protein